MKWLLNSFGISALLLVLIVHNASAQQGMGVGNNNPLEMLDVTGAIKIGTTTAIPAGGAGTIRWNGSNFQGWDGSQWVNFGGGGTAWNLTGNSGTVSGTNFIGTTDAQDFVIKRFNEEGLRLAAGGALWASGNTGTGVTPTSGAGTRMMWIPGKNAFRAGIVTGTQWDNANIGRSSAAFGEDNIASGVESFVSGKQNTASGPGAVAFGWQNVASGTNSAALGGQQNTASGFASMAINISTASGQYAFSANQQNIASGKSSSVFGWVNTAPSFAEVVVGTCATNYTPASTTVYNAGDRIFNVGNGTSSGARSDAFTVLKNGNVGVGTATPAQKLDVAGKIQMQTGATTGYVPVSDASGTMTWTDPTALTITETDPQVSSTTTNHIPKWNGTTLVDGVAFDNGTNVGIGTTTPTEKLEIQNGNLLVSTSVPFSSSKMTIYGKRQGGAALWNAASGGGPAVLNFDNLDPNSAAVRYTGAVIESGNNPGNNDGNLRFLTANNMTLTEAMRIDYVGNIGMGAEPTEKLHVVGHIRMVDGSQAAGYVPVSDVNGTMTWTNPTALTITETDPQVSSATTNHIPKWNGTTLVDGVAFDNGTNVGIGTTSPAFKLDVNGTFNASGGGNFGNNVVVAGNYYFVNTSGTGSGNPQFRIAGFADKLYVIAESNGTGPNGTEIRLRTASSSTTAVDRVTIDKNGKMGIGVTAPAQLLDVNGKIQMRTGAATGFVPVSDASGTMTWTDPTALTITETDPQVSSTTTNHIPKWNGTTLVDGLAYDDGTNIGIGTTTPGKKLDVNGDALVNALTIGKGAGNQGFNSAIGRSTLFSNTSGNVNTAVGGFVLYTNTTGSDNTGAGFNSLYYNSVGSYNTATGTYALYNTTGSGNTGFGKNALYFNTTGSNNTAIGYESDVTSNNLTNATVIGANASVNASNKVQIGDGNVTAVQLGTGTNVTLETGRVKITGGTPALNKVLQSDAAGLASWVDASTLTITETDPQVSSVTTNMVPKWNGTTLVDGVLYDNGANVGIGTANPTFDLDIYKNETAVNQRIYANDALGIGQLVTGANGGGEINLIANSSASTYLGIPVGLSGIATNYTDLVFATGTGGSATERMRVSTGGNLGVGITNPSSLLHVAGSSSGYGTFMATIENTSNSYAAQGLMIKAGENTHTNNSQLLRFSIPNGTVIGAVIQNSSSSVSYLTTSDRRLKTNLRPTQLGIDALMNIPVYDYEYKTDPAKTQIGFVAQELYNVLPSAVSAGGDDPETEPWMVDYSKLTPLLVKAVQELTQKVEEQQKLIEELQKLK